MNPKNIDKRWEQEIPHRKESEVLYKFIAEADYKYGGDTFNFKAGGDGDNGDHLMYLFDLYFEEQERKLALECGEKFD